MSKARLILISLIAAALFPAVSYAYEARSGADVRIGKDEILAGNLYVNAENLAIDGVVKGDLYCLADSATISGTVEGSVFCGGTSISVDGVIQGSARMIGEKVEVRGRVSENLNILAVESLVGETAAIGWDALVGANKLEMRGAVGGSLLAAASELELTGKAGSDARFWLDRSGKGLSIGDGANIGGNLIYDSKKQAVIGDGAKIAGTVTQNKETEKGKESLISWAQWKVFLIFSSLVIGLVVISLWQSKAVAIAGTMRQSMATSLGTGAAILVLLPVLILVLALTVIGIPLAIILGINWFMLLYMGNIFSGIMLGRAIQERWKLSGENALVWCMLCGIILTQAIFSIPVVGSLASFIAMLWGVGGVTLWAYETRRSL